MEQGAEIGRTLEPPNERLIEEIGVLPKEEPGEHRGSGPCDTDNFCVGAMKKIYFLGVILLLLREPVPGAERRRPPRLSAVYAVDCSAQSQTPSARMAKVRRSSLRMERSYMPSVVTCAPPISSAIPIQISWPAVVAGMESHDGGVTWSTRGYYVRAQPVTTPCNPALCV